MRLLTVFIVLFTSYAAQAEIIFTPAISYFSDKQADNGNTTTEFNRKAYDIRLGWIHESGLYLGGMYTMTKTENPNNDREMTGIAPTVGFTTKHGFYVFFHYFLMAENKASGSKFVDGMGPQLDLGWVFPLTNHFSIGPQMSYRSVNYDKLEAGGTSSSVDITQSTIAPYLTLWFKF